jgi:hypothetical protein
MHQLFAVICGKFDFLMIIFSLSALLSPISLQRVISHFHTYLYFFWGIMLRVCALMYSCMIALGGWAGQKKSSVAENATELIVTDKPVT